MNTLSDADQADYSEIAEDCARAAIVNHEDNGPFRSTRDAARAVADLTTNISSTTALANFQQAGAICIQVIHQLQHPANRKEQPTDAQHVVLPHHNSNPKPD